MDIAVTRDVMERIEREARAAHPRECCGILLGTAQRIERIVPAANVHVSPETHFEIDPQALIDAHRAERNGGPKVVGYYHSHPDGEPHPSATDQAMASGDGRIWAILGKRGIMLWQDDPPRFHALSYEVVEV